MSGLLRRLAEQALGSGDAAIQPLARIAYEAPLELSPEVAVAPDPDRPTAGHRDADEGAADVRLRAAPRAHRVAGRRPQIPLPLSDERARSPGASRLSVPALDTPEEAPTTRVAAYANMVTEKYVSDGEELWSSPPAERALPADEPRESESDAAGGVTPFGPHASIRLDVPRALDAAARPAEPHPASSVAPSADFMGSRCGREPETSEVHVHIGRIEVTAVQEAPPRKPQSAPIRKPMTLDEYLARRKEGRA